jgi:copper chaperone
MRIVFFLIGIFLLISCNQGNNRQNEKNGTELQIALTEVTLQIGGMHCEMCVASIEKGVGAVEGVELVKAELDDSTAVVKFNNAQTNLTEITQAIEKRGYTVKK